MPRKSRTATTTPPPPDASATSAITAANAVSADDNLTPLRARLGASRLHLGGPLTPTARQQAQEIFLENFATTGNVSAACRKAFISRETVYAWRREDERFAAAWLIAEEDAADVLRAAARQRGVFGWDVPIVSMGRVVLDDQGKPVMERKYSDGLLGSMLKAHAPEYRDRREVELTGAGGGPLQMQQQVIFVLPEMDDVPPPLPFVDAAPPPASLPAGKDAPHASSNPKPSSKPKRSATPRKAQRPRS